MNYNQGHKLLKEAKKYIKENNIDAAKEIFDKIYKNDENYLYAVLITESHPEYTMFSKEFNNFLNEYLINII